MLWFIPGKAWDRHSVIPVMGAGRHTFSLSSSFNTDLPEIPDFFLLLVSEEKQTRSGDYGFGRARGCLSGGLLLN